MVSYTVLGFMIEGNKFIDFCMDVIAETPTDAVILAKKRYSKIFVSSVNRSRKGLQFDY